MSGQNTMDISVFMVSKFECRTKKTDLKLLLQLSSQDLFKLYCETNGV